MNQKLENLKMMLGKKLQQLLTLLFIDSENWNEVNE